MFSDEAFAEACRRTTLKAHHGREDEKHWSFHVECAFKSVLLVMSQRSWNRLVRWCGKLMKDENP